MTFKYNTEKLMSVNGPSSTQRLFYVNEKKVMSIAGPSSTRRLFYKK